MRGFMDDVLQEFPSRFFENWAEHTDIAILITDPEGAVRWSNPAFTPRCAFTPCTRSWGGGLAVFWAAR